MNFPLPAGVENAFYKRDWSEFPELFTPVIILCIITGVIGNMCFCFFFGNSRTRIYKSRDAVYFRRMSIFDMLVCVIVLPYSIFYEARFVNNRAVCKIMEYVRHVIIYTSHLILAAYCFELPRRVSYAEVLINVNRMIICNIALACVFSLPALFLFDVDVVYNLKDAPPLTKSTCHLVVSFHNEADDYGTVSLLRVHYYAVMCLCYAVALVLFIFKAMHYCEHLSVPGRRSVGVQIIERTHMSQLKTLNNDTWRHRIRRHSQTGHPVVFAEYTDSTTEDGSTENSLKTSNACQQDVAPSEAHTSAVVGNDRNIPYRSSFVQEDGKNISIHLDQSNVHKFAAAKHVHKDSLTLKNVVIFKSDSNSSLHDSSAELPRKNYVISKTSSSIRKSQTVFVMKSPRRTSSTWFNHLLCSICNEKKHSHSILKRSSSKGYLRIESYKQQFISLIILDFIFIFTAVIAYLIFDEHGVILSLIHTKCILSFYLVTLSHPGLRSIVRKHIIYYCLRTLKTKNEVTSKDLEET